MTNPEDVVNKESPQENESSADSVERQHFYSTDGKCQTKQVVGNPVLKRQIHVFLRKSTDQILTTNRLTN